MVVTRNHLWLVDSHHKGPSNTDVTSLTKIITWLQKYSWYHLWDHLSGLILDTSATANIWFNSDFILLSEFSYTYLHQASKHQQQIHVKNRIGPHQSADIHIGIYFPLFLSFLLSTLSSCFFFNHVFFSLFLFFCYLLTWYFFHHTATFFPVTFFPVTFFPGQNCYFFSCFFISIQTVTFFPVTFFPTQNCYFFSCYLFSCYFLSEHHDKQQPEFGTWVLYCALVLLSSLGAWPKISLSSWKHRHEFEVINDIWTISLFGVVYWGPFTNTLGPRQNGWHFADDISKFVFLCQKSFILIQISLKIVLWGPIINKPALVQIMAWCWSDVKSWSKSVMAWYTDTFASLSPNGLIQINFNPNMNK